MLYFMYAFVGLNLYFIFTYCIIHLLVVEFAAVVNSRNTHNRYTSDLYRTHSSSYTLQYSHCDSLLLTSTSHHSLYPHNGTPNHAVYHTVALPHGCRTAFDPLQYTSNTIKLPIFSQSTHFQFF